MNMPFTKPKVSVVIPAYQSEKTLVKAVESVLEQDYADFELIIVNNGSMDGTARMIEELEGKDSRIRSLHLPVNQRPAGGRNAGVQDAKGEYIAFLDADDIWLPGKLATQVDLLDENPDYDLVFGDSWIVIQNCDTTFLQMEKNEHILRNLELSPVPGYDKAYFVSGPVTRMIYTKSFINMSTSLMKRDKFLNVGGFDTDRFGTEDVDFWVRFSRKDRFIFWDQPLAKCYQGEGTSRPNEKWLNELIRYHRKSLSSPEYGDLKDVARANLDKAYRYLVVGYGLDRKPKEAFRVFRESLEIGFNPRLALYTGMTVFGAWPFRFGQWITSRRKDQKDKKRLHRLQERHL